MKARFALLSLPLLFFPMLSDGLHAAGNPLDPMDAVRADKRSPQIVVEKSEEGSPVLASIHNGDEILFKSLDFDSGVAACRIRLSSPRHGVIEIHLDSPSGPLMGTLSFESTGGWNQWREITCPVDHSQSGVRDVHLVIRGEGGAPLVNLHRVAFLKSALLSPEEIDLSSRLDTADDGEAQGEHAWGIPEKGFEDHFEHGLTNWISRGFSPDKKEGAVCEGREKGFAFTPAVYINKTDTGGEWRTLAEASLSAGITLQSDKAVAGIGFTSKDGRQSIDVVLNAVTGSVEARRTLLDGKEKVIAGHPLHLKQGIRYRMQIDWSPYSNALIALLYGPKGESLANFRTVIDLPAARRPLMVASGGKVSFSSVTFDPTLDGWNFRWEWRKTPVLGPDVCNPSVWKGKDGKFYMMWRRFGQDTWHGIASSSDAIHWNRVNDEVIKCTGDMNLVQDPFADGTNYMTGGGGNQPWYACAAAGNPTNWSKTAMTVGNIYGNCRIQEFIDTSRFPQMAPVSWNGKSYRFIAYTEDWNRMPKPHSVVLLSDTLTNWVQTETSPVIPPNNASWGELGTAIGSAIPLSNGHLLIAACSCTFAGYTGAPEPSNISAIADGKAPWRILRLGILPDAPVSRENVWYQGPNFGTAFLYDGESDTLYFYGGFHDYRIGMMRVRNFLHHGKPMP